MRGRGSYRAGRAAASPNTNCIRELRSDQCANAGIHGHWSSDAHRGARIREVGTGVSSAVATLNSLQAFAPAFFVFPNSMSIAAEEAGTGSLVADSSVVAGASPAKPGDIVSLYGTGFGDTSPAVPAGQLATGIGILDEFHHCHHRQHHTGVNPTFSTPGFRLAPSADCINSMCEFRLELPAAKFR